MAALEPPGVVTTTLAVHTAYSFGMESQYGAKLFRASLPHHTAFKEAVWAKTPLPLHKPRSAGAKAVMELALATLRLVAAAPPMVTAVAPVNPVPVIVTDIAPAKGPLPGLTDVTVGTLA